MENATMVRVIRVLEFIGELKDGFQQPFVVKYSDKADSPLQSLEKKLDNNIRIKQHLKLTQSGLIFHEGSNLNIEICKHFQQQRIFRSKHTSQDNLLCKARIKFDDLWDHLASEAQLETNSNFQVEFFNPIPGLQFWIVAEAYGTDLRALDAQIKSTTKSLKSFKPLLIRLGVANAGARMLIEIGKVINGLNSVTQTVVNCIEVVYKHFEAQKESHEAMQDLAESMCVLARQLDRLNQVPTSDELRITINEFPGMMEEVVDFIKEWLESWSAKYILVLPHKDQAIELRKKLDAFAGNFDRDLLIEIQAEQAIMMSGRQVHEPCEFVKSPHATFPNRSPHPPGPGSRPGHSVDSGSRSTLPHSPTTPQSPKSDECSFKVVDDTSPSLCMPGRLSHDTLKQEDRNRYLPSLATGEGTIVAPRILAISSLDSSDGGGNETWKVKPQPPIQSEEKPKLTLQIETSTATRLSLSTESTATFMASTAVTSSSKGNDHTSSIDEAGISKRVGILSELMRERGEGKGKGKEKDAKETEKTWEKEHNRSPQETSDVFVDNEDGWVMRPPPEAVYEKSIRYVEEDAKRRIDRTSKADSTFSDMYSRKRNTKFWGGEFEEVTTHQARSSSASSTTSTSSSRTTFKWIRGELIGKGPYGHVYIAINATTGEMFTVKQVEIPQTASDKYNPWQHKAVEALKLESEALKDLDHPNIVQYFGFEETMENFSIFLEYVPGGSIGSCLHKHGRFPEDVTKSFTSQILSGLEYLHDRGILHRDLKADSILVEVSGTCKISDFGISKRTDGHAFTPMQGTVFWIAPEVINVQKKGYNFKIDIWSLGCVVLEMWSGKRPWIGQEMVAVMLKLYEYKLPPVPEEVHLSALADDFRKKCFAINPDERPSAAALRHHEYLNLPPGWQFNGFT